MVLKRTIWAYQYYEEFGGLKLLFLYKKTFPINAPNCLILETGLSCLLLSGTLIKSFNILIEDSQKDVESSNEEKDFLDERGKRVVKREEDCPNRTSQLLGTVKSVIHIKLII